MLQRKNVERGIGESKQIMKIESKDFSTRDNKTITLREVKLDDAQELLDISKRYYVESQGIPYEEDEFKYTIEEFEGKIKESLEAENSLIIVATDNGKLVGEIELASFPNKIMKHSCCIQTFGILSEYQGIGIGKQLFSKAIDWANKNETIELLWLSVFSSNLQGINLYKKMGFEECGRMKNFFKRDNNNYEDDVTMILHLNK